MSPADERDGAAEVPVCSCVWVVHCGSSETRSSERLPVTFGLPMQLEAEQPGAPHGACDVIIITFEKRRCGI
ncbi:hypothetical protein EYF80_006344 [Liparis tanakae]|uniref:Uncharacterized protein n=1 Tax=Liparis tanakae TaxID=230148 RepID=A0A4Z2J1P2_9TELE|nr:hypothetical protein EYF80_006344 [Liparis tanakae]